MQEGGSLNEGGARKKERRGGRSNEKKGPRKRAIFPSLIEALFGATVATSDRRINLL